jgi:hypothetical protein
MNEGNGNWTTFIVLALIIIGVNYFWPNEKDVYEDPTRFTSSTFNHDSSDSNEYLEPENPYEYGTGHYAGYEWGAQGNDCTGNSQSFIEGCEEFQYQDELYSN